MKKTLVLFLTVLAIGSFYPDEMVAQDAQAKGPKYGQDSAACVMKISLYREFYKQWKGSGYKSPALHDALAHWRWVFNNCPLGTQNTYVDGVKVFNYLIKKEKNDELKEKYIDTLMMIYDQRIEYFPIHYKTQKSQVGNILGRKGVDLYQYRPDDTEEIYDILKQSIDLQGNTSQSAILVYYFRATTKLAKEEKLSNSVVVETYDIIMDIIDYNIKNNVKKKSDYENAQGNIELTFEPFASCDDLIGIYTKKFNEQGDDVDVLKKIIKMLDKKGCSEYQLFFDATVRLYDLDPDAESAFLIGRMYLKKGNYNTALDYLLEGVTMEDIDDRANCYLLLADTYRNLNNFPKARSYAYQTAELRPNDGNPYLLIGDMYAASAKECGDNDLTKKVAYWAAVDKYKKAKKIDPSIAEAANGRISTYSKVFPTTQTIFFHDLNEGDSYKVECWINETTTVRAAK